MICSNSGGGNKTPKQNPSWRKKSKYLGEQRNWHFLSGKEKTIVKSKSVFAFSKFEIIFVDGLFYRAMGVCIPSWVFSPDFGHHHGLYVSPFDPMISL